MSKDNTGGPAFPLNGGIEQLECKLPVQGMTMRDYFAAKALQGLISSEVDAKHNEVASHSYRLADAMLEARK